MPPPPEFYKDLEMPEVTRLARAICRARGSNPDLQVPETGYTDARFIPYWWKFQDSALDFLACWDEMKAEGR